MIIDTPDLPLADLGLGDDYDRYTVPVRREVWLVFHQERSLRRNAPDVWRVARAFLTETEAIDYITQGGAPEQYRLVQGVSWETREVWVRRCEVGE